MKKTPAGNSKPQQLKRRHSKDRSKFHVTFWLPNAAAPEARSVTVAGSFNDWNPQSHSLKKLRNGEYSPVVALDAGREHEFRFVIDGARWENAWNADKYVWSAAGNCENSVVIT